MGQSPLLLRRLKGIQPRAVRNMASGSPPLYSFSTEHLRPPGSEWANSAEGKESAPVEEGPVWIRRSMATCVLHRLSLGRRQLSGPGAQAAGRRSAGRKKRLKVRLQLGLGLESLRGAHSC